MHEKLKIILPFGAGILKLELLLLSYVFSGALNSLRRHSLFQPTICSGSKHQFFLSQQKMFSYSLRAMPKYSGTMIHYQVCQVIMKRFELTTLPRIFDKIWQIACEFIGRNKIETRGQNESHVREILFKKRSLNSDHNQQIILFILEQWQKTNSLTTFLPMSGSIETFWFDETNFALLRTKQLSVIKEISAQYILQSTKCNL